MTKDLLDPILGTGIVGVFCVIALLIAWRKDKEVAAKNDELGKEKNLRIEDAKAFNATAMAIQKEVVTAVQALTVIASNLERAFEERERLAHEKELFEREVRLQQMPATPTPPGEFRPHGPPRSAERRR